MSEFSGFTWVLRVRANLDNLLATLAREWEKAAAAGQPIVVTLADDQTRTIEQNKVQWPILQAWAEQKPWQVNGRACHLPKEDWKDILTAAFDQEDVRIAPGLAGGMVLLGHRTSKFGKKKFSRWIEFLKAASAQQDPPIILPPAFEDIEPDGYTKRECA